MEKEKKITSYVCTASPAQMELLGNLLRDRGWEFNSVPYAHWKAVSEKINVVAYLSGKLTVQGRGTEDFIQFILEPEILHEFTFSVEKEDEKSDFPVDPHGGIDESGKGDFFGPLAVAGVYVDAESAAALRKIGVCDSKLIKSSTRIFELADKIRQASRGNFTTVLIGPEAYNRLYQKVGNLNRLLAWGHARVIENLLDKVPDCPRMLSDKFGAEHLIARALLKKGREIKLDQAVRAESDVAVAAASILAREQFLRGMDRLSAELGVELPRGGGPGVLKTARELYQRSGEGIFSKCAKLHFKTFEQIKGNV